MASAQDGVAYRWEAGERVKRVIEDRRDDAIKDDLTKTGATPTARLWGGRLRSSWMRNATVVFWLMFAINAVNYLDRLIVIAVGPALKADFNLQDSQIGILSSAFILVYTLAALPCGLLADRFSRTRVITFGVALWSVMSAATAFVRNFPLLFFTRAMVGVGEAS
jgi:MFS family permease